MTHEAGSSPVPARAGAPRPWQSIPGLLELTAAALMVVGLVTRLAPLFDAERRLFWQFPTEDGYLTLTISRNLALGNGISVADGTIPTNGTQPLAMFLWAGAFWLVGADRFLGVGIVLVLETLLSVAVAALIVKLGQELFGRSAESRAVSWLAAALWFASPVSLQHTMNCLETTLYALCVMAAALVFLRLNAKGEPLSPRGVLKLGLLLGAAFWARNDAVFWGAGIAVGHVAYRGRRELPRRVLEVAALGGVAGIVGAPWLINNYFGFGHVVPISGISESMHAKFGENLSLLPVVLAEYVNGVVPIPLSLEENPAVIAACGVFVLAIGLPAVLFVYRRAAQPEKRLMLAAMTFALLLSLYYGTMFGARHFLARYLFPTGPFLLLLWAAVAKAELARAGARTRLVLLAPAAGVIALSALLGHRLFVNGARHQHQQVVEWVRSNVAESTWVGATQTGTLGFFHDRTINLDGKVNPEALAARTLRRVPEYAYEKGVAFIADWAGFAGWATLPVFAEHFELIVNDPKNNLAVLRRKGVLTLPEQRGERAAQRTQ